MDVHGVQASYNHQTFNITSSSSRVSFYDSELEGGTIASVVAGAGNNFYNAEITDAGLTLSGGLNLFEGGTISHTVTITGKSNTFRRVGVPGFPFDDQSASTKFEDLWNYSGAEEVKRGPLGQRQAPTGTGGITPVTSVYGKWDTINTTTTPQLIASTNMAAGKAWKAIFIGTWESYGTISTIPPYLELTDTSNTVGPVPYVNITMTFSLNARGQLQMSSNGSDANVGFNGWVFIVPATQAASAGGTSSMQLAGNMKAASIQVGSGAVMAANHGTGMSVQHSDGTGTTGGLAAYAADGSVTAGPTPPTGALVGTTDTQTLTNKSIAGSEINSGTVGVAYGGTGQNESTATGIGQFSSGTYNVSTALANGTTATTQSAGDNSSKVATTSYVASPGAIAPTVVTATGIITGGNDTARTTAATIGTTAFSSTGLVLPTVPASTTKSGRCVVLWQMSSTSYTATFGIGMSNAPAGLWGGTSVTYAAAGTSNWLAFSQTATAPTSISTAVTAAAANTTYRAEIDFTLQTGSSNPVAITLYGLVSQASATLAIQPGSACYWLP